MELIMPFEKRVIIDREDLAEVIDYLKQKMSFCKVFAFSGALGAGKTVVIRELLRKCGISGIVTSPTFTYLNSYKNKQGETFYHFDLYRIKNLKDFLGSGFDEYLYIENSWSFIEWPEVILSLLTHSSCFVDIIYHKDPDKRILTIRVVE